MPRSSVKCVTQRVIVLEGMCDDRLDALGNQLSASGHPVLFDLCVESVGDKTESADVLLMKWCFEWEERMAKTIVANPGKDIYVLRGMMSAILHMSRSNQETHQFICSMNLSGLEQEYGVEFINVFVESPVPSDYRIAYCDETGDRWRPLHTLDELRDIRDKFSKHKWDVILNDDPFSSICDRVKRMQHLIEKYKQSQRLEELGDVRDFKTRLTVTRPKSIVV